MKKVKCPNCKGEFHPIFDAWCNLCEGTGKVTQKQRMEYVRSFKEVAGDE